MTGAASSFGLTDLKYSSDAQFTSTDGQETQFQRAFIIGRATRETFNDAESERLLRGFLSKALFDAGLYCRADDRGDPVIQLAPPLIMGPDEFDDIESRLRSVLIEAENHL